MKKAIFWMLNKNRRDKSLTNFFFQRTARYLRHIGTRILMHGFSLSLFITNSEPCRDVILNFIFKRE